MPKYWVKNYFAHGSFPEVGQKQKTEENIPGTAGGLKRIKFTPKKYFFLHISSSYAKILGRKLFRTWEIPQSGSKAEDGGKREKERKREREKD